MSSPPGYEIIEHTADVGIRAWGKTLEDVFEQAAYGLLDIQGTRIPREGEPIDIEVRASDPAALLVDWLNEIIYLHDSRDIVVGEITMHAVDGAHARARVVVSPRGDMVPEGTAVKAATYHQVRVQPTDGGFEARIYVDV